MKLINCPVYGPVVISTLTSQIPFKTQFFRKEELIMSKALIALGDAEVVTLPKYVEALRIAVTQLQLIQTHPVDAAVIGVLASDVAGLQLVLARTQRKQADVEDTDLVSDAKAETQATRDLQRHLRPLLLKARSNQLNAEEFFEAIHRQADPDRARNLYIAMSASGAVINDNQEILANREEDQERKKVLRAAHEYSLNLMVHSIDSQELVAKLILVGCESECPLFMKSDEGSRRITLTISEDDVLRDLALCQGFKIGFTADLAISMTVSSKGYSYMASLVKFSDPVEISRKILHAMRNHEADLFGLGFDHPMNE